MYLICNNNKINVNIISIFKILFLYTFAQSAAGMTWFLGQKLEMSCVLALLLSLSLGQHRFHFFGFWLNG